MNIYIPDDLKQQMDAVGRPVKWSAVAQRAFRDYLGRLVARNKLPGKEEVIARLKASKRIVDGTVHSRGYEAGLAWARREAPAYALQSLERYREGRRRRGLDGWGFVDEAEPGGIDAAEVFCRIIEWEEMQAGMSVWDWWQERVYHRDAEDPVFVKGFADGAMAVWEHVKDEVLESEDGEHEGQ